MRQGVGKHGDYSAGILLDLTDLLKAWLHSARAADAVKYADTPANMADEIIIVDLFIPFISLVKYFWPK